MPPFITSAMLLIDAAYAALLPFSTLMLLLPMLTLPYADYTPFTLMPLR